MINFSDRRRILQTGVLLLILAGFWAAFAPTQLGGPLTYAIVDGISMEERFRLGDLILVREAQDYQVGDAVVYHDRQMNSFVFHRIVGSEAGGFILKGDNNSWLDSYRPAREEIVGKLWLHIPKLGIAMGWMREPINMSLTVGLLGVVLMSDLLKSPSRQKPGKVTSPPRGDVPVVGGLYFFGMLFLVFAILGFYSLSRPLHIPVGDTAYSQEGFYTYSATGTPGVYDNETVQAGEPVFPRLTCFLNVGLTYTLAGEGLQGTVGNYRMSARIMDEGSGWQRTIPLNPGTAFSGNSFFTMTTLDLCQVESLVALVEQEAGLKQTAYTLEIVTDVVFAAEANGILVNDSFSPTLEFTYNKVQFHLADSGPQANPLRTSKQGSVNNPGVQTNTISMAGLALPVWILRLISMTGLALSLFGLAYTGMHVYQIAIQSQDKLIGLKYGSMIVDAPYQALADSPTVIDVASMDDLARLAERQGTLILHMSRNSTHSYIVQVNGASYRYIVGWDDIQGPAVPARRPEATERVHPPARQAATTPDPLPYRAMTSQTPEWDVPMPARSVFSNEDTQPVLVRAVESEPAMFDPDWEELQEYVIDIEALKKARPVSNGTIEYVIDSGVIEYSMTEKDTVLLRKIRL